MPALRILVGEDDPAVRRLVSTYLSHLGHTPVEAAAGGEPLSVRCLRLAPDLVIGNVGGSGLREAEAIRRASDVPIILMSGNWAAGDAARAAAIGARSLQKPFDLSALAAAVAASTV